jgi:hypothetical protein
LHESKDYMAKHAVDVEGWGAQLQKVDLLVEEALQKAAQTRRDIMKNVQYIQFSHITLRGSLASVKEAGMVAGGGGSNDYNAFGDDFIGGGGEGDEDSVSRHSLGLGGYGDNDGPTFSADGKKKTVAKGRKTQAKAKNGNVLTSMGAVGKTGTKNTAVRTSTGNKKMCVPDELIPELAKMIGCSGNNERNRIVDDFAKKHPETSVRQVNLKFGEITTRAMPKCVLPQAKRGGRAISYYLRPRFYDLVEEHDRPPEWEQYLAEDRLVWDKEQEVKAEKKVLARQREYANRKKNKEEKKKGAAGGGISSIGGEGGSSVGTSLGGANGYGSNDDEEEEVDYEALSGMYSGDAASEINDDAGANNEPMNESN